MLPLTVLFDDFDVVGWENADIAVQVSSPPGLLVLGDQVDDVTDLQRNRQRCIINFVK